VLLVYARKGSGEPSVTYEESVEEALCFGWIDGVRQLDDTHFTTRFTPRKPTSISSKINVERLIEAGRMRPAGLAPSKRAMPAELREALARDRRGRAAFEALTPARRSAWTRWVAWAARDATRKQRARDALLLIRAGRKAGETDAQAARPPMQTRSSSTIGSSDESPSAAHHPNRGCPFRC